MEVADNTERPLPLKEECINNISREKKTCRAMHGHLRKDQGWSGGRRGEKGEHAPEPFLGFSWEGTGKTGPGPRVSVGSDG